MIPIFLIVHFLKVELVINYNIITLVLEYYDLLS